MTPLVSQLWPQFMADPDFAACFGRVVVEHAQMLRQERQVIFTLRSSAPLDKGLCARLLASLAPDYEGFELRINNLFGYATLDEAGLRELMEERGDTYEQLGERLHMTPQTLNRYVLGRREPKVSTATAIAMTLGVDPLWLQGYSVPRRRGAPEEAAWGTREHTIPILGVIRAGAPILAVEDIEGYAAADVAQPEEYFYLRVTGDSMINAGIRDGDLVLLRRQESAENGQIVACLLDGADATLKRLRVQRDMAILQPENPAYEPRIIPLRDFGTGAARIVGVAVRLVRDL